MIPNRYHFVWFGKEFPFTHALAIRSLAATSAPDAIVLHVTDDLVGQTHFDRLVRDVPALRVSRIDLPMLLDDQTLPGPDQLREVWNSLVARRRWAALSDILRYLVLYREGGVYLDLDTITVRDLRPLLAEPGFCGRERILVDAATDRQDSVREHSLRRYLRSVPLDVARWVFSHTESGIRHFGYIADQYPAAINGAVLALPARHPLARQALERVPQLAPQIERRRPIIGPDLLQDLIDGQRRTDLTVFDPPYFYPLGPQMAAQLFRIRGGAHDVTRAVREAILPQTHVVHWYNDNLKDLPRPPDATSIRALGDRQLFSRLALPFLPAADNR